MKNMKRLTMSLFLLLSGCWARSYDLVQNGIVCVDLKAPKDIPLKDLSVTKEDSDVVVKGYFGGTRPPPSVTVSLVAPNGRDLAEVNVRTHRPSRRSVGRRFEVRLNGQQGDYPPKGSTLRIAY